MKNICWRQKSSLHLSWAIPIATALILGCGYDPAASACDGIKIMPLGDSLTKGVTSTSEPDVPGYRGYDDFNNGHKGLLKWFNDAGISVDYVGSQSPSPNDSGYVNPGTPGYDPCRDNLPHEGHPLFRIGDPSFPGGTLNSIYGLPSPWKPENYGPEVILLMIGTNDYRSCDDPTGTSAYLADLMLKIDDQGVTTGLIGKIRNEVPDSVEIYVGSIPDAEWGALCHDPKPNVPELQDKLTSDIAEFASLTEAKIRQAQAIVGGGYLNVHFVDVGSSVQLTEYSFANGGDGVHPKNIETYTKMAEPWFLAYMSQHTPTRYWFGKEGYGTADQQWNNEANWRLDANGTLGAPIPSNYSQVFLINSSSEGIDKTAQYQQDAVLPAPLFYATTIDAPTNGTMILEQSGGNFQTHSAVIGDKGKGYVFQRAGAALMRFPRLGMEATGNGTYTLFDNDAATLTSIREDIGYGGKGTFNQLGGTNNVQISLVLGRNAGSNGTYVLSKGKLNALHENVGINGTATFHQTGGANNVYVEDRGELGDQGTLWIARQPNSNGMYLLEGGTLTAVGIVNNDEFIYTGGELAVMTSFTNYGAFQVAGTQRLQGDLIQESSGVLEIAIDKNLVGELTISQYPVSPVGGETPSNNGVAQLSGVIKVSLLAGQASLSTGATLEILSATQVAGFKEGLENVDLFQTISFNLPTLAGNKILRPSQAGGKILLSYVDADCGDHAKVKPAFGKKRGQVGYNAAADFNGDGVVDGNDLELIRQKIQLDTCPGFH